MLQKKEVLSERGNQENSFTKNQNLDMLYKNQKKGIEGVLSVDQNPRYRAFL